MAYDQNNIFAKIVRGEAPAFKVFEDDHTIALRCEDARLKRDHLGTRTQSGNEC